jgi:hypothetical protein
MDGLGQQGVLQVIPPAELERQLQARSQQQAQQNAAMQSQPQDPGELAQWVRGRFDVFRNHRNTAAGWSERLLQALRTFNGQYDQTRLQEIRRFGGSEIFVRMSSQKCRAASSLLRDIYLSQDRPWAVRPPSNPAVSPQVVQMINQLVQQEAMQLSQQAGGGPPPGDKIEQRRRALMESAEDAAKKKVGKQARESEDRIEDMLRSGGFYHALAEFLVDLPVFPFACIKGPVVKVIPTVTWPKGGGAPSVEMKPTLTWNRVSPFDIWFTPGVADIENAEVIEKLRVTRGELNDLLDLPGYNSAELRAVLDEYGRGGLYDAWDSTDAERAVLESKENPAWNRSGLITMFEYHGNVQGRLLQEYGLAVQDELRDYNVECWIIGSHVIKCHLNPSPRQRNPYFITSFEKVPGTIVGNSLIDLLADIQEASNATMRSMINNMSIASGPQVVINDDRLSPDETGADLYPWKRWHTRSDPVGSNTQPPIQFFMPVANAQQCLEVFGKLIEIADDVSAIPKYVGGQGGGGAGRTASGLAMLMGNASKILQTVSANIDRDVVEPALLQLSDLILLTDASGMLTGEEKISVLGVNVAIQRETIRQRQIEFLQATMNPTDQKIMGIGGRGAVLRSVSQTLGLNGEDVVPSDDKLEQMEQQERQAQAQGPVAHIVEEGVNKGIAAGIQRITSELTSGEIATQLGVGAGPPTHEGAVPGQQPQGQQQGGPPQPGTNHPAMDLGPGGDSARMAAQGQGQKQGSLSGKGMGPQTRLFGKPSQGTPKNSPGVG